MARLCRQQQQQQQQNAVRTSRGLAVRCRAEKEDAPKLSFDTAKRGRTGYLEEDSAGQTNIFAVEPKTYVQGSAADDVDNTATVSIAGFAFVFAMAAVGLGLLVNGQKSDVADFAPTGEYLALSEYKAKFAAELSSQVAAAPTLTQE